MKRKVIVTLGIVLAVSLLVPQVEAAESAFSSNQKTDNADSQSAFSSSSFANQTEEKLTWGGTLKLDTRSILDKNGESDLYSDPILDLDLNYKKANSEVKATLNFVEGAKDEVDIEEAFIRLYYDNYDLVVGKKKEVWGNGDKLHVVDNLNGENLTDFINQDYLDRQIGEEMIKMNYYLGTGTLEAVYSPNFTPDHLATSGQWVTNKMQNINNLVKNKFDAVTAAQIKETLQSNPQQEIEDGQLGLRYTNSQAGYDYGFSFYQGHLKRPSMSQTALGKLEQGAYSNDSQTFLRDLNLHYDEVSIFGAEVSSVLAGINSRAEVAYYLTDDTAGDDADVHNNKVAWLIGGDRDLPLHNLNVNLQVKSEYVLEKDEIKDNTMPPSGKNIDIDYNKNGDYFTNMVVLKVSDQFKNETITPQVSLVYNVENEDYMLDNELELKLKDDTRLLFHYKLFEGANDTNFGQFDENDYLSAVFEYDF